MLGAYSVSDARRLAAIGQLDSALTLVRRAADIDRELSRPTLEAEAKLLSARHYAPTYAALADSLARLLQMPEAITAMDTALALDSAVATANQLNSVCWFGALRRMAARVMPFCEKAVSLAPSDTGIKDSRGLARALLGQAAGAIKDFSAFINDESNTAESRTQRRQWVVALRARTSPDRIFTDSLLTALASP